jgi:hypothetical protein
MFDHNKVDHYTLYLAAKSYGDRLNDLQQLAYDQYTNGSPLAKKIGKIILGSSKLAALGMAVQNNFVTAFENDLNDPTKRTLYLKQWKINAFDIIDIQDHPQTVIFSSPISTAPISTAPIPTVPISTAPIVSVPLAQGPLVPTPMVAPPLTTAPLSTSSIKPGATTQIPLSTMTFSSVVNPVLPMVSNLRV